MNKYLQAILLLILAIPVTGQYFRISNMPEHEKAIKNCYYITLNNDTIETTILYSDIINLQHKLVTTDSNGSVKTFWPGEIKGFGVRNIDSMVFATHKSEITNSSELYQVRKHEFVNTAVPFTNVVYLPQAFSKRVSLYFESASIDSITKLFINVRFGDTGSLRYLNYYYDYHLHYYRSSILNPNAIGIGCVELYEKDNTFFDRTISKCMRKGILWFSKIISDDTLLSTMVKKRKLTQYMYWDNWRSLDVEMLITEYNKWRCSPDKKDTSLALKGILDADKYYRPSKLVFWGITAGFVTCYIPGLVTACIINSHAPKEKNLNIPLNCKYCGDEGYLKAYKMRAKAIKGKASDNGLEVGFLFFIAAIVIVVSL